MGPNSQKSERLILVTRVSTLRSPLQSNILFQRKGQYPHPPGESDILGLEASGIVERLGPRAAKWKPGDRVMALVPGLYISHSFQHFAH